MPPINREEITRLTSEYGGAWGINHTRRLLALVDLIGQGQSYDADAVFVAAHLHDWGGYKPWLEVGVDHAVRSAQVAEPFLIEQGYPPAFRALVLECIASHHRPGSDRSVEALLLRDADALDFLGVVGVLRDFSKAPKQMRQAYESVRKRRRSLPGILYFPRAKEMAAQRIEEMDALLAAFEQESFGCF